MKMMFTPQRENYCWQKENHRIKKDYVILMGLWGYFVSKASTYRQKDENMGTLCWPTLATFTPGHDQGCNAPT